MNASTFSLIACMMFIVFSFFAPNMVAKRNEAKMKDVNAWIIENNIANRRAREARECANLPVYEKRTVPRVSPAVSKVAVRSPSSKEEEEHIEFCRRRKQYNDLVGKHCQKREGSKFWDPVRGSMLPPVDFESSPEYVPNSLKALPKFKARFLGDYIPRPKECLPKRVAPPPRPALQAPVIVKKYTTEQLFKAADYLKSFSGPLNDKIAAISLNKWIPSRLLTICIELKDILEKILPDARVLVQEASSIEELRRHLDYPLAKLIDLLVQFGKEPSLPEEVVIMSKRALELFILLGGDVSKIPTGGSQGLAPAPAPKPPQSIAAAATTGKPFSVVIEGHTWSRGPVPPKIENETLPKKEAGSNKREREDDGGKSYRNSRSGGRGVPY